FPVCGRKWAWPKRRKAAEEAKPDQGDGRGELVSRWRLIDQQIEELASFL
ncbi:hypothetical protein GBF38_001548, partial [Nibea albiflora]